MNNQEENKDFMPKAQVEIMLEGIRGDFKVFGEGLNDVKRNLGELKETVDSLVEDMDGVKSNIVDIKLRLDSIDEKLENKAEKTVTDEHETRIVKLEKASLVSA